MRIALRTGAGRGAYELAGSQDRYHASDLFDKVMSYELTPDLIIPGRAIPGRRQGKPRIVLVNQTDTTHFYRILAGLLLLPKPKRELKSASGETLVSFEAYSITIIKLDIVSIDSDSTIVRPTELILENCSGLKQKVDFVSRMSRVMQIWRSAQNSDTQLAHLLTQHQQVMYQGDTINHKDIEKTANKIFDYLGTKQDPLHKIESNLSIATLDTPEITYEFPEDNDFGSYDEVSPILAKFNNIRQWKEVAVRGSAATKFRSEIKRIYNDTCLFTGQRLPKLDSTASSGVDAAHILPWASYGLNAVSNGICLSKQCHWAFDAGVIRLSFDPNTTQYVISIPDAVTTEALRDGFSLDFYQSLVGVIPRNRLPQRYQDWPNPEYINSFNKLMFS